MCSLIIVEYVIHKLEDSKIRGGLYYFIAYTLPMGKTLMDDQLFFFCSSLN